MTLKHLPKEIKTMEDDVYDARQPESVAAGMLKVMRFFGAAH